jgi:hypothetical protein
MFFHTPPSLIETVFNGVPDAQTEDVIVGAGRGFGALVSVGVVGKVTCFVFVGKNCRDRGGKTVSVIGQLPRS